MAEVKFRVPVSSLPELKKIIQGYASMGEKVNRTRENHFHPACKMRENEKLEVVNSTFVGYYAHITVH